MIDVKLKMRSAIVIWGRPDTTHTHTHKLEKYNVISPFNILINGRIDIQKK